LNTVSEYIKKVESRGSYTVSLSDIKQNVPISDKAIFQALLRLKRKGKITQIRREFYLIVPIQYSVQGFLPTTFFLDDMMRFLERPYYLGLLSAAAIHGAAHQQPMLSQVMVQKPALRTIRNEKLTIKFYTKSKWNTEGLMQMKTDAGYFWVSTPELTALDLVQYHKKIGGLNRVLVILEELIENINRSKLTKILAITPMPTVQRFGYLLDFLEETDIADTVYRFLKGKKLLKTPLSLSHKKRNENIDSRWSVLVNQNLDTP
jgi:predicted transcriptional regulator of viral defense system